AYFFITHMQCSHPHTGVHDREVETCLIQPLVHELWQRTCCPIEGILSRVNPPMRTRHASFLSFLPRHTVPWEKERNVRGILEALSNITPADLTHVVEPDWLKLGDVAVGVDDRVIQFGANSG